MVDARVVSRNHAGLATVDAGYKALSSEDGSPPLLRGAPLKSTFEFMGDEHGLLTFPEDADPADCPGKTYS
jgi:D-serine deaminase-like pyridoxal phosphate-dependent protein